MIKGSLHPKYKKRIPTVVSIYADSFSLICPGFEISVPEVSAYMILNAVECLSF